MKDDTVNVEFKNFVIYGPDNRTEYKLEENGKIYKAQNPENKTAYAIQIDGGLINSLEVKKCDKGLCVEKDKKIYLVELKGSDISTACKQLNSTLNYMQSQYPKYTYYCRGVVSRLPKVPKYYPNSYLILRKKMDNNKFDCDKSPYEKDTI